MQHLTSPIGTTELQLTAWKARNYGKKYVNKNLWALKVVVVFQNEKHYTIWHGTTK